MTNTIVLIACIIGIAVSIAVSFKWGFNLGLLAMSFAFVIGCLMQGSSVSTVFNYWPSNLIFFLISSGLFFGYAAENGTMVAFGNKLLWQFRRQARYIPLVVFLIAAIMALLGANVATIVFLTPIAFSIGLKCGTDPLLTVVSVNLGYITGTYNPWTGNGVQLVGLIENNGVAHDLAMQIGTLTYFTSVIKNVLFMIIFFVFYTFISGGKKKKQQGAEDVVIMTEKPVPFTPVQKKTLGLVVACFVVIVIPSMLDTWGLSKGSTALENLVKFCQPQSLFIIFALVASFMNLASTKKVVERLPMNTILLIAGVCFLIEIAKKAELLEVIAGMFTEDMPTFLVAPVLTIFAGILSIFSSTWSVVLPLMCPLVPALQTSMGLNPVNLYSSILNGGNSTSYSPFSTNGAQMVALAPDEIKDSLVKRLLKLAFITFSMTIFFALIGMFNLLHV